MYFKKLGVKNLKFLGNLKFISFDNDEIKEVNKECFKNKKKRVIMERLDSPMGKQIDRSQPIEFSFEGKKYSGFKGDTIASALFANGVLTLSRSFKYHRARGVLTMAGHDSNTMVQIGD